MHEISFWLRIIKEHALFIKLGLPANQGVIVQEAKQFYNVFEDLESRVHYINCDKNY